ncbi:peptidase U32 family protein [Ferrimonas lipolytica]|uniref:U32 family peptidase n=1 Tax=Ferrimonas lipolytica TaxID=2724191 RepID=A0A6H1UFX7_9GAMM|nr:peptidase U32 family protein [Ferrimonas lipolytica]QIZ77728.1 U32 family peptidase [Ferrimonas lipolytica]
MSNRFELLAPGGDIDSIKAAIAAGADAVYCGLDKFNARHRADNLDFDALNGVIRVAHQHGCKIFLTLNIIILQSEFVQMWKLLNLLHNSDVDGVILQDIGLFGLVKQHFPQLDVHASTQSNTHNSGQIEFLNQLGASRVNLSRELSLKEIKPLASFGAERGVQMEVFVHGSYCIGFSGLCYMSSEHNGSSGNRGRCSQPCRDPYQTTAAGSDFPLNMKDNSAFSDMAELADAGVYSLKVEGRIKKSHYVYSVVDQWRKQIDNYCQDKPLAQSSDLLYTVFNRDFTAGFLHGDINHSMYSNNPRDNSAYHFAKQAQISTEAEFKQIKRALYDVKTDIINHVSDAIAPLDISKRPLTLSLSGQHGEPLTITLIRDRGQAAQVWTLQSSSALISADKRQLDIDTLLPIFKPLNDANHQLQPLQLLSLGEQLLLPFAELTAMREQLFTYLRDGKPLQPEVALPAAPQKQTRTETAKLAVLLNRAPSEALLQQPVELYYQLPEALDRQFDAMVELFTEQPRLLPWFPAILLGKHFDAAKRFLERVRPSRLVTNNSGIVKIAQSLGLKWVAGPQFNLTNSYAFEVLQQQFGCVGGFLSNELSRRQLYPIAAPKGMDLYYSIYHPQALMTSRMCFLQQTVGCHKPRFTEGCLRKCDKSASLVSFKNSSFVIDKQRGDHNVIYANDNFLNLDAINDLKQLTHGFIDLRQIETGTRVATDNAATVAQFLALLAQQDGAASTLQASISGSSNKQYQKGL